MAITPRKLLATLLDLVYPEYCVSCRIKLTHPDKYLCKSCACLIVENRAPFCRRCASHVPFPKDNCERCSPSRNYLERVWAWGIYDGPVKKCIQRIKYGKDARVIKYFNVKIRAFALDHGVLDNVELVTYVPLESSHQAERTFNQSGLIAGVLSRILKKPAIETLTKIRPTPPQSSLSRQDRFTNVDNVMRVKDEIPVNGKSILLVDDVFTTGATMNECARVLLEAGAAKVYGFALARGA